MRGSSDLNVFTWKTLGSRFRGNDDQRQACAFAPAPKLGAVRAEGAKGRGWRHALGPMVCAANHGCKANLSSPCGSPACPPPSPRRGSPRPGWGGRGRCAQDRKSAAEGSSVSVRVDLGGGRLNKNKKYKQTI